jgi:hypothetical protein
MSGDEQAKAIRRASRAKAKADGMLTANRAVRFTNRKRKAARDACRGKVDDE